MRFNPKASLDTSNVGDAGPGGGSGGGLGGGGMRFPLPGGAKAGGGMAGVLLVILVVVLQQCAGIDLTGGGSGPSGNALDTSQMIGTSSGRYDGCKTGDDANRSADCARVAVENSLRDFWSQALPQQRSVPFHPAKLETFTGATQTGCGRASSQVGPFYCPNDEIVYLDTTFFKDVLQGQLGGPAGAFVEPYVIGHEYGHHIQNLLGTMSRVRTQQGPKCDSVRLELQADCYAGIWAHYATQTPDINGQPLIVELTDQDIQQAIEAAKSVGDDRIQQRTQGRVTPESWTHGSAAERVQWFQSGYANGRMDDCDTFAPDAL